MENLPVPEIFIDKNGQWYADGVLMTRKDIVKLFASHLRKESDNQYYIVWQNQWYPVQVEDAPFFVQSVTEQDGQLMILLYDGREMPLPSGNMIIKNNIPYITLIWPGDTKLSHAAYNELGKKAIERKGQYYINYGGNEWPVIELR
ncbi:MAG: DUF1285 domain-containing protein [Peptococcaceae bacterium]|nr:DUF1285 domain-containing protein [Peptococcaceae bacterium]